MNNSIFESIRRQHSPDRRLNEKVLGIAEELTPGKKTVLTESKEEQNGMNITRYNKTESESNVSEVKRHWGTFAACTTAVLVIGVGGAFALYNSGISDSEPLSGEGTESEPAANGETDGSEQPREIQEWAKAYLERNDETVGFIRILGLTDENGKERINYPVLQSDPDSYDRYMRYDFDGALSEEGSIFADSAVPIDENGQPDNIVIYGHNMRNSGTMFSALTEYPDNEDFLTENPIIEFNTIYDSGEEYVVIRAFEINLETDGFDYWRYRNFDDEYSFDDWLDNITMRSEFICDVQCDPDDDYITLSTGSENENTRCVVVAKKLDDGDDKETIVTSYKTNELYRDETER